MDAALVAPGDGEVILNGPIRIRILEDGTHTGHRVGITENVLAPAITGPPQHIHREHDETFFVVSGTVRFTSGSGRPRIFRIAAIGLDYAASC